MTDTVAKRAQDYIWEATRKSRILLFSGSVNERSVRDACDRILALEFDDAKKPITLVKMKDKSNREVADATGKALEDVERDTKRDLWLSASEAIEYGLISRIIQSINELD